MRLLSFSAVALIALLTSGARALDADAIKALAEKPHDREGLLKELEIYPDAREYEIRIRSKLAGEEFREAPPMRASEKVVEGKYIVSHTASPGADAGMVMVVTFDRKKGVYRKWVLLPDDEVGESIGTAIEGLLAISWTSVRQPEGYGGMKVVSIESHTASQTRWREVIMKDGDPISIIEGTAKKTK